MTTPVPLYRRNSSAITEGPHRAGARAMLKAVGFDDDALKKPIVGVANTWIEIGPCNYHLRGLAEHVKQGIREAGGTPMEFGRHHDGQHRDARLAHQPGGDRGFHRARRTRQLLRRGGRAVRLR
jgi:dihydroxyacid dehydratase/phosphogluconate dehydratase